MWLTFVTLVIFLLGSVEGESSPPDRGLMTAPKVRVTLWLRCCMAVLASPGLKSSVPGRPITRQLTRWPKGSISWELSFGSPAQFVFFVYSDQKCFLAGPCLVTMSQNSGNIQQLFIKPLLSAGH